jgi:DNA-directed RNA polymerase specialized sigma24 family protein
VWNESSQDEDRELVVRCQEGDSSAFEELVQKYQTSVINLAYHYIGHGSDLEDIAQKIYTFSELNLEDAQSIEKLMGKSDSTPTSDESNAEMQALLKKLLDQLPELQRRVIVLRDIEAIPYSEMAVILKCTEQAARLKVFRARNRLKTILEKVLPRSGPRDRKV